MPELARRLREGTAEVHRAAERMALIQALLRGLADRPTYAALLAAYARVYAALERALVSHAEHPVIAPLVLPELWRREALARDLAALAGAGVPLTASESPATAAYCRRLDRLAAEAPELLVAHAYTRYLGDLSGGSVLGRLVGRALDLRPGAGLDFYAFPAIDDVEAYRVAYRGRLDRLPIGDAVADAIVDEARAAFACNIALFAELEGSALRGLLRLVRGRGGRRRDEPTPLAAAPAPALIVGPA